MNLDKLLKPKSIAIVGASDKDGFGGDTCRNLFGFTQKTDRIYLVNPKRDELFGRQCYHSLADIPDEIDLCILCTPQSTVCSILEQAASKGCGGAVVFASGYSETGAEGREREQELRQLAHRLDIALMGPNCAGFANYIDEVMAFAFQFEKRERQGGIGMISQSGQLCLSALDYPQMNFSYIISSGNSCGVSVEDYLSFLVDDDDTRVVLAYIEGVRDPKKLVDAFSRAAKKHKPIVVLKTGRSQKSQQLAASHTGSLAGSDKAISAIFERYGIIRTNNIQEFFSTAAALSALSLLPGGSNCSFMCVSGGEAGVTADLAEQFGIGVADIGEETEKTIKSLLPGYATVNNPLDMTASIAYDEAKFASALSALLCDPAVDCVCVCYTITDEIFDTTVIHMTNSICSLDKAIRTKPIFWLPFVEHTRHKDTLEKLTEQGVPVLPSSSCGFEVLGHIIDFSSFVYEDFSAALPEEAIHSKRISLSEYESMEFLRSNGIKVPEQAVAADAQAARMIARRFGYPLVCKVNSPDILHKSDIGGVMLNLNSEDEVAQAFEQIMQNAAKHRPEARVNGVLIKPMLKSALELIVGVNRDQQFGPMLMVGLGGVFVEVFRDVKLAPAPISEAGALELLRSLKGFKLLTGYRGAKRCNIDALVKFIVEIGELAADKKDSLCEMDLNPIFVDEFGVTIADALVVCQEAD